MSRFKKITSEVLRGDPQLLEVLRRGNISTSRRGDGVFLGCCGEVPQSLSQYGIVLPKGGLIIPNQDAKDLRFLVEHPELGMTRSDYESLLDSIRATQKPWAEPWFIGLDPHGRRLGFGARDYYNYYPAEDGHLLQEAWRCGVHIVKKESCLLCKVGDSVVTGNTVSYGGGCLTPKTTYDNVTLKEPVRGIIPLTAKDGFYYWPSELERAEDGAPPMWEHCRLVYVRVTEVNGNPSKYTFVGVQRPNGCLVRDPDRFVTDQEFFSLGRHPKGELSVVETPVHKGGWFTHREKVEWIAGSCKRTSIPPVLAVFLDRLPAGDIRIERVRTGARFRGCQVTLTAPGLEPCSMTLYPSGPSDPEMLLIEEATAEGPHFSVIYSDDWMGNVPDPRVGELMQLVRKSPWVMGPFEERALERGVGYYLTRSDGGDYYKLYSPLCVEIAAFRRRSDDPTTMEGLWEACKDRISLTAFKPPFGIAETAQDILPKILQDGVYYALEEYDELCKTRRSFEEDPDLISVDKYPVWGIYLPKDPGNVGRGVLCVRWEGSAVLEPPVKVVKDSKGVLWTTQGVAVGHSCLLDRYAAFYEVMQDLLRGYLETKRAGLID